MRILLVNDSLVKGGKERRMIELIKGLLERPDVKLELVLLSNVVEYPEIHDLNIPLRILERKPAKDPRVCYRLMKICKTFKADIIHSWSSISTIFAFPAVKWLNIKLINANIADAPKDLKIWGKQLFRAKLTFPYSDVVVSNSKAGLKAYFAPESKGVCIHNGFDFNRIRTLANPESIRQKFNIKTPYVIGKIAAFAPRKDYFTYLKAAVQVVKKRNDVTFLSIGDGPLLEECRQLIPTEFNDRILFTGVQRDVESIINIFTVGALSTNVDIHGEGISNSIMEYMVLSKPVVATEGGGTNEIIVDGVTGYLVPPKAPESMAEKFLYLLEHPEAAKAMGARGRQRIYDCFNLEKMTETYYQLYRRLIGQEVLVK